MTDSWTWRHAVAISDLPADCKYLLLMLSTFMNDFGECLFPEMEVLIERCGKGKAWVHKYLKLAGREGWLMVEGGEFPQIIADNLGLRGKPVYACLPDERGKL